MRIRGNKMEERYSVVRRKLIPYVLMPAFVGVMSGILIFLFKIAASHVLNLSGRIYAFIRENPQYIPLLLLGALIIGSLSSLILKFAKECRGGGIPTAVASIRGYIPLKWVQGVFVLFFSALLTFLVGVPLGNEGPSVQMGTALGKGSSKLLGKKRKAWERYEMTSGACAGFAVATGAPISGILFALEETHRRFSLAIFTVASIAVITGSITQELLSSIFGVKTTLFDFTIDEVLPAKYLWIPLVIGIICAVISLFITDMYRGAGKVDKTNTTKLPFTVKVIIIFIVSALFGLISSDFIGTGHDLIESILHGDGVWYILIAAFVIRAALMIFANGQGVSGGIFVPNLTFGAIIAALISKALISAGVLEEQYFPILVVVGMASFLSAASRTPITALVFAAEALCLAHNVLPVAIGVAFAYMLAEFSAKHSFADAVIESKFENSHHGMTPIIIDTHMTVMPSSIAIGQKTSEILWPPTCVVLSMEKHDTHLLYEGTTIRVGDVLHLHYQTYDPKRTYRRLTDILGEQPEDSNTKVYHVEKTHLTPID